MCNDSTYLFNDQSNNSQFWKLTIVIIVELNKK